MSTQRKSKKRLLEPNDGLAFFQGFLRRPQEVGSVIPSSRFLERRIVEIADISFARVLVELGPGTGGTTRALLRAMHPDAKLLSMEINRDFFELISRMSDARLIAHHGSALGIGHALGSHGLAAPDVVLSGIPFSTMKCRSGVRLLRSIKNVLAPGGRFVAYQFRDRVGTLGNRVFGSPHVELEILNVPPMRVYRWDKQIGQSAFNPASAP